MLNRWWNNSGPTFIAGLGSLTNRHWRHNWVPLAFCCKAVYRKRGKQMDTVSPVCCITCTRRRVHIVVAYTCAADMSRCDESRVCAGISEAIMVKAKVTSTGSLPSTLFFRLDTVHAYDACCYTACAPKQLYSRLNGRASSLLRSVYIALWQKTHVFH